MDIGQILPGTSPPNNFKDQNNLNQLQNNSTLNNSNIHNNNNSNNSNNNSITEPVKRIYSSKSKTIHIESNSTNHTNNGGHQMPKQIVMSSGGVFPMHKQPNYFFPPFPSPNSNGNAAFIIPPFPSPNSSSTSNTLLNTSMNQQVDLLMNQSGYSTSSSSPNSANCVTPQLDLDKSNIDSVPIKKRQKKLSGNTSTLQEISNQIVTTDEENAEAPSSNMEKKRQRNNDMDRQKEKKERRLIRNRQSAQASRERKKLYIQALEEKVANLEQKVKLLEDENALLRRQVV